MEIKNFLGQNFIVFDTIDETVEYAIKNMNGQTVNAYTVADWSFEMDKDEDFNENWHHWKYWSRVEFPALDGVMDEFNKHRSDWDSFKYAFPIESTDDGFVPIGDIKNLGK